MNSGGLNLLLRSVLVPRLSLVYLIGEITARVEYIQHISYFERDDCCCLLRLLSESLVLFDHGLSDHQVLKLFLVVKSRSDELQLSQNLACVSLTCRKHLDSQEVLLLLLAIYTANSFLQFAKPR
jgi:hypothetical protein